jgi:CO/xanthine dehydrogenase Mo-binding subunit
MAPSRAPVKINATYDMARENHNRMDYALGAELFSWSRRDSRPRSMRDGRLLIGMGVVDTSYPAAHSPSNARVRLLPDGTAEAEVAASDIGPGTYTSMTQVAAGMLSLPMEQVRFSLGRSDFPPAPPHGGSRTMASVGSALRAAIARTISTAPSPAPILAHTSGVVPRGRGLSDRARRSGCFVAAPSCGLLMRNRKQP